MNKTRIVFCSFGVSAKFLMHNTGAKPLFSRHLLIPRGWQKFYKSLTVFWISACVEPRFNLAYS